MESKEYTYQTLKDVGEGQFRDRGSKFLGFSFPVTNRTEIKECIKAVKSQHPKANHCCYAWRLGTDGLNFRANDAGEPSSSAGRPILGQIDSFGLTNVLIVVVRYFGGTLLGIPGLIHAYKTTAALSLSEAPVVTKAITTDFVLTFDYTLLSPVMQLIRRFEAVIRQQKMELFCSYEVGVPIQNKEAFLHQASAIRGLKITPAN